MVIHYDTCISCGKSFQRNGFNRLIAGKCAECCVRAEFNNNRLKVCPNGHCYKHTEYGCSFCGYGLFSDRDTFVDRIDRGVPFFERTLYVEKREREYVLTENVNIVNKISKIEIGFNPKYKCQGLNISYKFYYNVDGETFDNFYCTDISIGKLSIMGKKLVEMCDKIIDRKQEEIVVGANHIDCEEENTCLKKDYDEALEFKREVLKRKLLGGY